MTKNLITSKWPSGSNNYKKYTHKAFVLKRYSYIRIVMITNADVQIQTKIGEKIKATRLKQNITQESLAESALISRSSVQKVESGEIKSFDTFLRILRTLGMLDEIHHLCKEEELSPSEYYNLVNSILLIHTRSVSATLNQIIEHLVAALDKVRLQATLNLPLDC